MKDVGAEKQKQNYYAKIFFTVTTNMSRYPHYRYQHKLRENLHISRFFRKKIL